MVFLGEVGSVTFHLPCLDARCIHSNIIFVRAFQTAVADSVSSFYVSDTRNWCHRSLVFAITKKQECYDCDTYTHHTSEESNPCHQNDIIFVCETANISLVTKTGSCVADAVIYVTHRLIWSPV